MAEQVIRTHPSISRALVGSPVALDTGYARARLEASADMADDERGLMHGGFAFGLADYAAMLAVNDPHAVLGAAHTRFTSPVTVGEIMTAEARVLEDEGRKRVVECEVWTGRKVFEGTFTCFVPDKHILD